MNITPKEKAKELIKKMHIENDLIFVMSKVQAKKCALIAVDEILDLNLGLSNCDENNWAVDEFYNKVKQEIKKL